MTEFKRATASRDDDHFPEDLMDGILVRLPSSCLRRFLCVSKSWYRLLSNPNFIYRHLFFIHNDYRRVPDDIMSRIPIISRDSNLRYCSLSCDSSRIEVETPFRDLPLPTVAANPSVFRSYYHKPPIVMGACGGLICVRYTGFHRNRIGLFDPATSEMKLLLPKVNDDEFPFPEYNTYWIAYGFGFDRATGEYKVVRVRKLSGHAGNRTSSIHVWSSTSVTDSWRKVEHDRGVGHSLPLGSSVSQEEIPQYCPAVRLGGRKGKCFWAGWRTTYLRVISFDMTREALEVKTLATPRCCDEHRLPKNADEPRVFMLKEETLAIFHVHGYSISFDIWVLLNNVGESWSKLFTIPTTSWSSMLMRPIGLSREGEVILWGAHAPAELHVLDPTTGQMYALPIEASNSRYPVQQLATYVPMELPLFG
ncbi:unnamed protein product [Linum trigynum]|uniref:F-box domain-containing protein n=1 Tax=Linum trigynum TaxID=586398 RepID=A0AAV2CP96_9ROSI